MPRESADDKARRLLTEGRITIMAVDPDARASVVAEAKGDSGAVYALGFDRSTNGWRCTCEAASKFGRRCSHLRALQLVTVRPTTVRPQPTRGAP